MTATPQGALTVSPEQTDWTAEQAAALGWAGPKKPSRGEALRFLTLCQRTGLDPFANQLYLIERGGRWAVQTGIDGFRVIRDRIAQQRHLAVGYDDTLFCGPDGQWTEVWLQNTPPAAAKVTVTVAGEAGVARFGQVALWREYGSDSSMWRKLPSTMLAKVAEAQALRRAFPHDLSGLYTADEMAQAEPAPRDTPRDTPRDEAQQPQEPAQEGQGAADHYASILAAADEQELRACWEALRATAGQAVAETPVLLPVAWQEPGQPVEVPLYRLVGVAKQHLGDDPYEGDAAEQERQAVQDAHPDDLPLPQAGEQACGWEGCPRTATAGVWCALHDPNGPAQEPDHNSPRMDPEQVPPKGAGRAAARAAADEAAQRAQARATQKPRRQR